MASVAEERLFKNARQGIFLADVENALARCQPELRVVKRDSPFSIEGAFLLTSPDGPFDKYDVKIELDVGFPNNEPSVFEVGGRIPKSPERHINPGGDCCITVWETWLALASGHSFFEYLDGPLREFFLNQYFFEKTGEWRFGERPHFTKGMVEAYSETLGVEADKAVVRNYLHALANKPKGHLMCPCGGEKILRHCHQKQLHELYARFPEGLAARMLNRLSKAP
jgi:hypothetical protein